MATITYTLTNAATDNTLTGLSEQDVRSSLIRLGVGESEINRLVRKGGTTEYDRPVGRGNGLTVACQVVVTYDVEPQYRIWFKNQATGFTVGEGVFDLEGLMSLFAWSEQDQTKAEDICSRLLAKECVSDGFLDADLNTVVITLEA